MRGANADEQAEGTERVVILKLTHATSAGLQISSLIQRCEDFGMPMQQLGAVRTLLMHAGADK